MPLGLLAASALAAAATAGSDGRQYDAALAELKELLLSSGGSASGPTAGHSAAINAASFESDPAFYGPVQLHCAELTAGAGPGEIRTVIDWHSPGWAPEGVDAALSIRSMTKVFVSAAVLEITQGSNHGEGLNSGGGGGGGVGAMDGSALTLDARLGDVFPDECGGEGHLLRDATVDQLLNMQTRLDLRTAAFYSADHVEAPGGVLGAPGTHPCELRGLSHAECVRQFVCPLYAHEDVVEAARRAPHLFRGGDGRDGSGGDDDDPRQAAATVAAAPFAMAPTPVVDLRCIPDDAKFAKRCGGWAAHGFCVENSQFMLAHCAASCHVCAFSNSPNASGVCEDEPDCRHASEMEAHERRAYCTNDPQRARQCPETCRVCPQMRAHVHLRPTYRVEHSNSNAAVEEVFLEMTSSVVYDNIGYLVLDAMVQETTGKSVADWILELVADPLHLRGILRCVGGVGVDLGGDGGGGGSVGGVPGCYTRARKGTGSLDMSAPPVPSPSNAGGSRFPPLLQQRPGMETPLVSGVNLVASSSDVVTFLLALLCSDGYGDVDSSSAGDVFSAATHAAMFRVRTNLAEDSEPMRMHQRRVQLNTQWPVPGRFAPSQTFEAFQYGLGYNLTGDFFSWGSTYGGRFFVFPREDVTAACMIHARIPLGSADSPNSAGYYPRYAARQHSFTYRFADAMLKAWPATPLPTAPEVPVQHASPPKKKKKKKKKKKRRTDEL